jgi:hypothetical protein
MTYAQRLINAGYPPSVAAEMQRIDDFLRLELQERYTAESYAREAAATAPSAAEVAEAYELKYG